LVQLVYTFVRELLTGVQSFTGDSSTWSLALSWVLTREETI
jgi:hypothetical protein